jgi:hypothetical protein
MAPDAPKAVKLHKRKYSFLVVILSVVVCAFPFAHGTPVGTVLLQLLFLLLILAAILAAKKSGREVAISVSLGSAALLARVAILFDLRLPLWLEVTMGLAALAFFAWVLVVLIADIFARGEVTGDKICGAICVYLLIGITWAILFGVLELASPGSFALPTGDSEAFGKQVLFAPPEPGETHRPHIFTTEKGAHLTYLSFITLTSTGYGDLIPVSHAARTFSWLEAVVGQLYLAILVARLVGMHMVQSMPPPNP